MKLYQKFTLIIVILGLIIPALGLYTYFFNTSLIPKEQGGYTLAFNGAIVMIIIISMNVAVLLATFKIKNTKIVGIILMGWGIGLFIWFQISGIRGILMGLKVSLFVWIQIIAIPGLILLVIAGILALREGNPDYNITSKDEAVCRNCQTINLDDSIFCNNCGLRI